MLRLLPAHRGSLTDGFLLLRDIQLYVLLSHYLCFISFLCTRRGFMDTLGIVYANQTSKYLDPQQY